MKKKESNRLYMYRRVRTVCNDHEESWKSVPAFVEAFEAFSEKVTLIGELGTSQSTITTGVKRKREKLVEDVVDITLQCAAALRSFAIKTGDAQLTDTTEVHESDILQGTLNQAVEVVRFIAGKTAEYADELEDYGITPEKQQSMQAGFQELRAGIDAPRVAIASRRTITNKISRLVKEADELIENHIDGLMRIIKDEAPEFYVLYLNARVAVKSATRSRASDEPSGDNPGESDDVSSL